MSQIHEIRNLLLPGMFATVGRSGFYGDLKIVGGGLNFQIFDRENDALLSDRPIISEDDIASGAYKTEFGPRMRARLDEMTEKSKEAAS